MVIVCCGFSLRRKRFVEAFWILYFAHSSLASARHIPLFMIVASPAIAQEASKWWNIYFADAPRNSVRNILHSLSADVAIGFRRTTFWIVAGAIPVVALTAAQALAVRFRENISDRHCESARTADCRLAAIHF